MSGVVDETLGHHLVGSLVWLCAGRCCVTPSNVNSDRIFIALQQSKSQVGGYLLRLQWQNLFLAILLFPAKPTHVCTCPGFCRPLWPDFCHYFFLVICFYGRGEKCLWKTLLFSQFSLLCRVNLNWKTTERWIRTWNNSFSKMSKFCASGVLLCQTWTLWIQWCNFKVEIAVDPEQSVCWQFPHSTQRHNSDCGTCGTHTHIHVT